MLDKIRNRRGGVATELQSSAVDFLDPIYDQCDGK